MTRIVSAAVRREAIARPVCYNEFMFGYIVPFVPELKVREFDQFRAYYCGLCRTLKDRYGRIGILNYDAAFLYMLCDSFEDTAVPEPAACVAHPFVKRPVLRSDCADYAADINVLMAASKAYDDRKDEGGLRARLRAALLKPAFARARSRAPQACEYLDRCVRDLATVENSGSADADAASDPYAALLGQVFADGYVLQSHVLYDLGYNLGRWVYMIDALDDMEKDAESGQFNVFLNRARVSGQAVEETRKEMRFSIFYTLSQAQEALSRLEIKRNRNILNNIVMLGLRWQTESILAGKGRIDESLRNTRRI